MNYDLQKTNESKKRLVARPHKTLKPHHSLGARFVVGLKGHIGTIEMVAQVVLATRCSTNLP